MTSQASNKNPAFWVPTVYVAEGLPFVATNVVSVLMYKSLGLSDAQIAGYTSILALPWSLKFVWSPFMEMYRTKKFFVVMAEILGGAAFGLMALSLSTDAFIQLSLACFAIIAFNSATHDIAADGLYIQCLSEEQQAKYVGWQGACWNFGKILAQGALVKVAGHFENTMGPRTAWMIVMAMFAGLLVALGLYHGSVLPTGQRKANVRTSEEAMREMGQVIVTFLKKKHVYWGIAFILLYRFAEGQAQKIFPLFLRADRAHGGLGLSTGDVGLAYGTFGALAFISGSILGGYFSARLSLRRALLPLCAIFNLPYLAYVFLVWTQPESLTITTGAIVVEMFGYGFGFVGITLFMMQQIATGPYKMAHYAFATSVMGFGMMLPGTWSGLLSDAIGYKYFFLWVMASTLLSFIATWLVPFKTEEELAAENEVGAAPAAEAASA
jgi:PAT family beta-lactamase induction signal transducer AmpG